uniref:Uncharacterized protein n=1 Tax=uncultured prokaryote TaxID=198431 RepID=A0A0H5Q3H6_9ZZZZ|nr:hypothetical protein [uncultured prokaryote]
MVFRRKRSGQKRSRKHFHRKVKKNRKLMIRKESITYMPGGRLPYPPRYKTKFNIGISGEFVSPDVSGVYQIMMNSPKLPFDVSTLGSGLTNFPGSLTTVTTQEPVGYSNLCNANFYAFYKVLSSKIQIQLIPGAPEDTILAVLVPIPIQIDYGGGVVLYTVPSDAVSSQVIPLSKDKLFAANQQGSPLRHSMTVHKLFGISKRALEEDMYSYAGAHNLVPTCYGVWNFAWETTSAVELSVGCSYRVDVEYEVELFNQNYQNLLQT